MKLITIIIIPCTIARIIRNYFIYFALALAVQSHVGSENKSMPFPSYFQGTTTSSTLHYYNSEGFYRRGISSFYFLFSIPWALRSCSSCWRGLLLLLRTADRYAERCTGTLLQENLWYVGSQQAGLYAHVGEVYCCTVSTTYSALVLRPTLSTLYIVVLEKGVLYCMCCNYLCALNGVVFDEFYVLLPWHTQYRQ
jgi:hypothetical protein